MHTVKQVSELAGVTVRTLHHYDELGLLPPSGRSEAGYRLADPRFTAGYDRVADGLAAYVRAAVLANADGLTPRS